MIASWYKDNKVGITIINQVGAPVLLPGLRDVLRSINASDESSGSKVKWERKSDGYLYHIGIPPNTSASVQIRARSAGRLSAPGRHATASLMKHLKGFEAGSVKLELPAGQYLIRVKQ